MHGCMCVSYPGDIHDLDGCQLPRLNMATLVKGGKERESQRHRETKKDGAKRKQFTCSTCTAQYIVFYQSNTALKNL